MDKVNFLGVDIEIVPNICVCGHDLTEHCPCCDGCYCCGCNGFKLKGDKK